MERATRKCIQKYSWIKHTTHTYDEVTDWKKSWSKVDGQNHTHRCFSYAIFDVNSHNIVAKGNITTLTWSGIEVAREWREEVVGYGREFRCWLHQPTYTQPPIWWSLPEVVEEEEEAAHLLRDDRVETPRRASFPFSWCYDSLTHTHNQQLRQ